MYVCVCVSVCVCVCVHGICVVGMDAQDCKMLCNLVCAEMGLCKQKKYTAYYATFLLAHAHSEGCAYLLGSRCFVVVWVFTTVP